MHFLQTEEESVRNNRNRIIKKLISFEGSTKSTPRVPLDIAEEKDVVDSVVIPRISLLFGYEGTKHSNANNLTDKWTLFKMKDCKIKGSVT